MEGSHREWATYHARKIKAKEAKRNGQRVENGVVSVW